MTSSLKIFLASTAACLLALLLYWTKTNFLTSTLICLLAALFYWTGTNFIFLPCPADISNIPNLCLTRDLVTDIPGVPGGASLVRYKGDVVTGTQDGYLVGINPDNAEVKWKIKCPTRESGGPCRILGLRVVGEFLYGVDLFGRLFKFQSGEFQWLLDSKSPEIAKLNPGFFNDLVIHEDVAYITDSFTLRDDKKHQNLFQRFYSFEADGKIIAYNLVSGEAWVFAENLHIPTGIELHRNNTVLLVSESNMYRILELDLKTGRKMGVFSKTGTLGAVGGVRRSEREGYWVAVSAGRTSRFHVSDLLAVFPVLRYLVTEYQKFYPLLGYLSKRCVEEPRFYRVGEEGHVTTVVSVSEEVPEVSRASSEVLEIGNVVFVGAPSSKSIFRASLTGEH